MEPRSPVASALKADSLLTEPPGQPKVTYNCQKDAHMVISFWVWAGFCSLATRASPYTQLTIALHSLLCCSHNDCFSVPQICHIPPRYHHICSMTVVPNFFGTRDQFSGRQLFPRTGGEMVSERFKCILCIAHFILIISVLPWLPRWHSGKEPTCQCRRHGLDSWIRKIPWRRARQPTPVFFARIIPWTGDSTWRPKE